MNDKQVKEKMERLDALSGGVVFGKEEAWEKLQARMDAKPKRKIVLWYRLTAAAVLLLCISIAALYYTTPEKQIAVIQPKPAVIENNIPAPTEVIKEPEKVVVRTQSYPIRKRIEKPVVHEQKVPEPLNIETSIPKPIAVVIVSDSPAQPIKKMRVVHVNDIGNEGVEQDLANVYQGTSPDINKMKVVSINDLLREEHVLHNQSDMQVVFRNNRLHIGVFAMPEKLFRNTVHDKSFTQTPLSLKFN